MPLDFSDIDKIISSPSQVRRGTELSMLPEDESSNWFLRFGKSWFPATIGLANDIAELTPDLKGARASIESLRATGKEENVALADQLEQTIGKRPTFAKVVANVAETALYVAPIPALKAFRTLPLLQASATGALLGTAYGITSGVRQEKDLAEIATQATFTGLAGGVLGLGANLVLEQGVFKLLPKLIPERVRTLAKQKIYPVLDLLNTDFGDVGKNINRLFQLTRADSGVIAGGPTLKAMDAGILTKKVRGRVPLTDEEAFMGSNSLVDLLEGKGVLAQATPKVQKAYAVATDEIYGPFAHMAEEKGILAGEKANYFTQITPVAERVISTEAETTRLAAVTTQAEKEAILLANKYKGPLLRNAVDRLGAFSSYTEANRVLESWGKWVLGGGRSTEMGAPFLSWLITSGRATTMQEAEVLAKNAFKELIRPRLEPISGFLEKPREINFPFYDPDPRRVIPAYIADVSSRLAYLQHFGKGGMATLLKDIETTQGRQQMLRAEEYARTMLGTVRRSATYSDEKALTDYLRALNTPKLSFSAITNLGQSLNTLLGSDLRALGYGLRVAFTDKGFQDALQSGAILQSVMHRVLGYAGGGRTFGDAMLKYSGFSWSEMFNRIVASNAGMNYLGRQASLLQRFPDNQILRARVEELGQDVEKVIASGITREELLRAGNIFSAKTQFLNDPASLPMFASSPWGQVLFQFKNYAYNQTRFVARELGNQWRRRDYSGLVKDLAILSLVFPTYGEISSDIRSTLTGAKRPTSFFARYFSNVANAGAFGLAFDLWQSASFKHTAEWAIGPTMGMGTGFIEALVSDIQKLSPESTLRFITNQTGFGRIVTGRIFPPQTRRKGFGEWWEFYEDLFK